MNTNEARKRAKELIDQGYSRAYIAKDLYRKGYKSVKTKNMLTPGGVSYLLKSSSKVTKKVFNKKRKGGKLDFIKEILNLPVTDEVKLSAIKDVVSD